MWWILHWTWAMLMLEFHALNDFQLYGSHMKLDVWIWKVFSGPGPISCPKSGVFDIQSVWGRNDFFMPWSSSHFCTDWCGSWRCIRNHLVMCRFHVAASDFCYLQAFCRKWFFMPSVIIPFIGHGKWLWGRRENDICVHILCDRWWFLHSVVLMQ